MSSLIDLQLRLGCGWGVIILAVTPKLVERALSPGQDARDIVIRLEGDERPEDLLPLLGPEPAVVFVLPDEDGPLARRIRAKGGLVLGASETPAVLAATLTLLASAPGPASRVKSE